MGGMSARTQATHRTAFDAARQSEIAVRPARTEDLDRVRFIYRSAIAGGMSTMDAVAPTREELDRQLHDLGPREALLVAVRTNDIVGFGWLRLYSPRYGYRHAGETSVYVAPRAEGQGVGSSVQMELLARARCHGFRYIVAKILKVNERSIEFHRRFGFEWVGVQEGIGEIGGVVHDVALLGLKLRHDALVDGTSP